MDNYEQAIKGVEFASKILQIRTPEVRFFTNEEINNRHVNALYKDHDNIIAFNEQWLKTVNNIEVQVACFHESRHAFQYEVVNGIYRGYLQIDLIINIMDIAFSLSDQKNQQNQEMTRCDSSSSHQMLCDESGLLCHVAHNATPDRFQPASF